MFNYLIKEGFTCLSLIYTNLVIPITIDKRVIGPRTPPAPDLTYFQK